MTRRCIDRRREPRPRRVSALERDQAVAVELVRTALDAEGLLDVATADGGGAAYVRMSHVLDRADPAEGVKRDAIRVVRWAKETGLDLRADPATGLPVFVDNSISASRYNKGATVDDNRRPRPAHGRLIDLVADGSVDSIVAPHLDRLYRQPRELEDLVDLVEDALDHDRVVTISTLGAADVDLNNSDQRAFARQSVNMAAHQSDRTHDRIMADNDAKRARGSYVGSKAPMGMVRVKRDPGLEHDPILGPIVVAAIVDVIAGKTLTEVAEEWEANPAVGRPRNATEPWEPTQVRQRLDRPALAGIQTHQPRPGRDGKPKPVKTIGPGAWEPLVDMPTWEAFQGVLAGNRSGRMPPRRGPFTGLFRCSECGHPLFRHKRARGRWSWACMPAKGGCGRVVIIGPEVEELVGRMVIDDWHVRAASQLASSPAKAVDVEDAGREVARLEAKLDSIAADYGDDLIDRPRFLDLTRRTRRDLTAAKDRLQQAQNRALQASITLRDEVLEDDWADMTADRKYRVLNDVYPHGIRVTPGRGLNNLADRLTPVEEP